MENKEITITVAGKAFTGKATVISIIKKALLDNGIDDIKIISGSPIPILTDKVKEKVKDRKVIIQEVR